MKRSPSSSQQPSSHRSRPFIRSHHSEWTAERTVPRWLRGPVGCAANESRRLNNDRDLTRKGSWQRCWASRFTTPYNAPSVGFVKRSPSSPQQPSSHRSRPFIRNHHSEWTAERTVLLRGYGVGNVNVPTTYLVLHRYDQLKIPTLR